VVALAELRSPEWRKLWDVWSIGVVGTEASLGGKSDFCDDVECQGLSVVWTHGVILRGSILTITAAPSSFACRSLQKRSRSAELVGDYFV